jgi:hypothetical protein
MDQVEGTISHAIDEEETNIAHILYVFNFFSNNSVQCVFCLSQVNDFYLFKYPKIGILFRIIDAFRSFFFSFWDKSGYKINPTSLKSKKLLCIPNLWYLCWLYFSPIYIILAICFKIWSYDHMSFVYTNAMWYHIYKSMHPHIQ